MKDMGDFDPNRKQIAIFGGGTFSWIASHIALAAPAFGATAKRLERICRFECPEFNHRMYLTKMAGGTSMVTNQDVAAEVDKIVRDDVTKIVFFSAAMVDFDGDIDSPVFNGGKYGMRLTSFDGPYSLQLKAAEKIISRFRKNRKDLFLVGFKQTCGSPENEQYIAGLDLCKRASCNLVLANDVKSRLNMVITPEEARYHVTDNREEALTGLVQMAKLRSNLTFTRSTVKAGEPVPWSSELVPRSLRTVVDHCIGNRAYKPFRGATVGHFACKLDDTTFLTSQRRTNFNDLASIGLVKIETDGPDSVVAYGSKPSVGGQSQRIVFDDHKDLDCIVHFHCPKKPGSRVRTVSQREFECGSHECGQNTSAGLQKHGNLYAVHLDQHGPNVVFHHSIDPQEVINFIDANFDLDRKTGGFVSIQEQVRSVSHAVQ